MPATGAGRLVPETTTHFTGRWYQQKLNINKHGVQFWGWWWCSCSISIKAVEKIQTQKNQRQPTPTKIWYWKTMTHWPVNWYGNWHQKNGQCVITVTSMMSVWSSNDLASRSSAAAIVWFNLRQSTTAKNSDARNWDENNKDCKTTLLTCNTFADGNKPRRVTSLLFFPNLNPKANPNAML